MLLLKLPLVWRLTIGFLFAALIAALTRQILHISSEMREGLTPFRLEAGAPGEMGAPGRVSGPGHMGQFAPMPGIGQPPLDVGGDRGYRPRPPAFVPRWDAPPSWG